jgi:hypothetical protein
VVALLQKPRVDRETVVANRRARPVAVMTRREAGIVTASSNRRSKGGTVMGIGEGPNRWADARGGTTGRWGMATHGPRWQ